MSLDRREFGVQKLLSFRWVDLNCMAIHQRRFSFIGQSKFGNSFSIALRSTNFWNLPKTNVCMRALQNLLVWTSVTNQNSGITLCEKDDCAGTMRQIADSNGVEALRVLDLRSQPQS